MHSAKKLLILSCSTGSGHIRAAEALRLTCTTLYPEIEVLHLDIAPYLGWFTYTTVVAPYNLVSTSNTMRVLYKLIYRLTDSWLIQKIFKSLAQIITFGNRKLIKKINEYQPDRIIATHYLAPIILPNDFYSPIDTVITDYYPHKTWLSPNIRNTFVATEEIKSDLKKIGINAVTSGIPIAPEFLEVKNITQLKSKLGIKNTWPIILIMPTGAEKIKLDNILEAIRLTHSNHEINAVIIDNKKIETTQAENIFFLNKINNIDEWMRIADVLVTKAGGLTITEALQLQKPMVIINSIPGQEDYNVDYLEKNNLAIIAQSASEVADIIEEILDKKIILNKKTFPDASKIILEKSLEEN